MVIGIEASLAFAKSKAGPENYYFQIIKYLLLSDSDNFYRLYVKADWQKSNTAGLLPKTDNYQVIVIGWPRLWTQAGLAIECLRHPPQVLFIPAHTMPVVRRPSLKTVVTIHDLGAEFLPAYHQFPHKYYLNAATEYASAHASHLIAVSKSTKNDLVRRLKVSPDMISVIYEGYDNQLFRPQSDDVVRNVLEKLSIEKPYFLFVGTVQPRKNLTRLIESFYKFCNNYDDYKLVIVGKKGWLSNEIYNAAAIVNERYKKRSDVIASDYQLPKKLGIEDRVKFLGYVQDEDLPSLYTQAQAFVFPSLFEGFGLPILEAMACGCPVLTSSVSSLPEVAGEAAIYVDPYDTQSMINGLLEIVKEDRRDKLRQLGFAQVRKFSWEKAATQTLRLLRQIGSQAKT